MGKNQVGSDTLNKRKLRALRKYISGGFGLPGKIKGLLAGNKTKQEFVKEAINEGDGSLKDTYARNHDIEQF